MNLQNFYSDPLAYNKCSLLAKVGHPNFQMCIKTTKAILEDMKTQAPRL